MSAPSTTDFTLAGYGALIRALLALNYRVVGYADGDPSARHLILRHDIDQELAAAVALAEVEAKLGVRATYFQLMRSEMYNPQAPDSVRATRRLRDLGHEVGLHFDASLYETPEAALRGIQAERQALEQVIESPVRTFSFHRPGAAAVMPSLADTGMISAYDPRYIREFGYCSDSRGGWHHGHPLQHEAVRGGRGLHLLTHAIWWATDHVGPQAKLESFLDRRFTELEQELARNVQSYSPRRR